MMTVERRRNMCPVWVVVDITDTGGGIPRSGGTVERATWSRRFGNGTIGAAVMLFILLLTALVVVIIMLVRGWW